MEQSVAPPTRIVEDFDEVPFVPMVDKVFLSNDPISMLSNSNFNGIKILVSTNQDGGSLGAREILPMEDHNEMDEDTFKMSAEMVLSRFPPSTQEKAIQYYIENDRHGSDYTTAFNNLIGDLKYTCSAQRFVDFSFEKGAEIRKAFFGHRQTANGLSGRVSYNKMN